MGSKAAQTAKLPGPPAQTEIAYLAGLLERGGFVADPAGLKLTAGLQRRGWLVMRFGGSTTGRCWWLTQQASLLYLLPRIAVYLIERRGECVALEALVAHCANRRSYHGDPQWRARRETLRSAVRAARGAGARRG